MLDLWWVKSTAMLESDISGREENWVYQSERCAWIYHYHLDTSKGNLYHTAFYLWGWICVSEGFAYLHASVEHSYSFARPNDVSALQHLLFSSYEFNSWHEHVEVYKNSNTFSDSLSIQGMRSSQPIAFKDPFSLIKRWPWSWKYISKVQPNSLWVIYLCYNSYTKLCLH